MIRKLMIFSLAGVILFAACKKSSSDSNPNKPVADSVAILGKWTLVRSVAYFYSYPDGAFMDSAYTKVSSQDYFNFSGGKVYKYENDASSNGPVYDTLNYSIYNNQYVIANRHGGPNDSTRISKLVNDSLMLTQIYYNTNDGLTGKPANEYDTLLLTRAK